MHNNMNINSFETNNIYTNKKPKTMRGNQSYGLSFGVNENGGYDFYQLSAHKKEESFWEKWKNVIIAGTVAVGAVVLGVVGYNKGWFGKIKKWFGKTETKAVKEAPKVSEKGTEVVQDEISKHLETLNLGSLKIGNKTLTDLLKPNNQTVTKAQFVAVAQEIKKKGNLTDNVKKAAVAVLERLRKNLKVTFTINDFDTTQEIKDVRVLDEIIKESSSVPQPQSEVPENETHNESETENGDQPEVPENPVSKDVKNSENDDDSLSEVTDETSEAEELVETEKAHADEMEDEDENDMSDKSKSTENENQPLPHVGGGQSLPPVSPAQNDVSPVEPVVPPVQPVDPAVQHVDPVVLPVGPEPPVVPAQPVVPSVPPVVPVVSETEPSVELVEPVAQTATEEETRVFNEKVKELCKKIKDQQDITSEEVNELLRCYKYGAMDNPAWTKVCNIVNAAFERGVSITADTINVFSTACSKDKKDDSLELPVLLFILMTAIQRNIDGTFTKDKAIFLLSILPVVKNNTFYLRDHVLKNLKTYILKFMTFCLKTDNTNFIENNVDSVVTVLTDAINHKWLNYD